MRRLVPDSVAARTLIVLLVGLTLSHIASTMMLSGDRHDAIVAASEKLCADRVATFAKLLDRSSGAVRAQLSTDLSTPLLSVSVADAPSIPGDHRDGPELTPVRDALAPYFGALPKERIHVFHRESPAHSHGLLRSILAGFPYDRIMLVSFQLSDASWANFEVVMAQSTRLWSPHALWSAVIMAGAIVALSFWATAWIGLPLRTFARAADRLGRDVSAPPLPESGPAEVRWAVSAFNEMQLRIRRFVEDRTRMLAAISHDLRSPITRMKLRTEMLLPSEFRDRMLAELEEMEAMVSSTMEFARGETAQEASQIIDLAALIEAICDNTTDMGLAADFDWQGRIVCTCRPLAMKRALTNLIENAARYGEIALVRAGQAGKGIEIVIEDRGPGIPADKQEAVFAPFFRVEESRNRKTGGMGLGMTVARTIIRSHGGDIRLANRAEGGLRVTVTLPNATEDGA